MTRCGRSRARQCRRYGIDAWANERRRGDARPTFPTAWLNCSEDQAFLKETFGEEIELLTMPDLKERGLWGPHFTAA